MPSLDKAKIGYSEQDTADKLILPFLTSAHKFPSPDSLAYQAQHTLIIEPGKTGRYDGLFLSGGYPYAVLEAKKYSNDLTEEDEHQARDYATSPFFDKAVPFIVMSNGREHRFLKITDTIDPADGKLTYNKIPATNWAKITSEQPGEVRRLLGAKELLDTLLEFKQSTYLDICAIFKNSDTGKFDLSGSHPLIRYLKQIIDDRKNYIGVATSSEQKNIEFALAVR
jgi:hypothetical protein